MFSIQGDTISIVFDDGGLHIYLFILQNINGNAVHSSETKLVFYAFDMWLYAVVVKQLTEWFSLPHFGWRTLI